MNKHRDRRPIWRPKIVPNRPRKFNIGDGFDEAREILAAACEKPNAEEDLKRTRIVSAALQQELDQRVSRRFCEVACLISLIVGVLAGFIACLVTH